MLDEIRAKGFDVGFFNDGVFVYPENKLTIKQKDWIKRHTKELYIELWNETSSENQNSITKTKQAMLTHKKK